MCSSHIGFQLNWACGKWCKFDGLNHKKQWIHSCHLLGFYHISGSPRRCPPLVGALGVHNGWSLKALQGAFEMALSIFPFKFPLVVVSTREMRVPSSTASCHRCAWDWLSFLLFGEYLGMLKTATLALHPLVQSFHCSRCQQGGGGAGSSVRPHSQGLPGEWEPAPGTTLLPGTAPSAAPRHVGLPSPPAKNTGICKVFSTDSIKCYYSQEALEKSNTTFTSKV